MDPASFHDLRQMQENIQREIEALELCWGCEKICACQQWLINDAVPVWLCEGCLGEVSYRLEERSGVPLSFSPAVTERHRPFVR